MAMSFGTALSGLSASSTDLSVIGNNISNANTVGFKFSRTEFADLYSASLRTYSGARVGTGIKVTGVVQQFNQGSANTTDQSLDLAISGDGFFRLTDANGQNPLYTRNGAFHIDDNNYIVNTQNQRLSAFQTDKNGKILGSTGDLYVDQSDIAPAPTTEMTALINLDAGSIFPVASSSVTASDLRLNKQVVPDVDFDPNNDTSYNTKSSITIYDSQGMTHTATTYLVNKGDNLWDVHTYVDGLNGTKGFLEVFPDNPNDPNNPTTAQIQFDENGDFVSVFPSQLTYNRTFDPITSERSELLPVNGGSPLNFDLTGFDQAKQITGLTRDDLGLNDPLAQLPPPVKIFDTSDYPNKLVPVGDDPPELNANYNTLYPLPTPIKDSNGVEHAVDVYFVARSNEPNKWDIHTMVQTVDATGNASTYREVFVDPNNPNPVVATMNLDGTLNTQPPLFEYTLADPGGRADPLKFSLNNLQSNSSPANLETDGLPGKFWVKPKQGELPSPDNYNYTTSTTIYDSQGTAHLSSFYFIKTGANSWDIHTFVDGLELDGRSITPPNTQADGTGSPVSLFFDSTGKLTKTIPAPAVPGDLGKLGFTASMANGSANIDFQLDITGTTQYGSPSGVAAIVQDGYTTGHISGINVSTDGIVSSLFSNGKTRTLGQVAMANFNNIQGLRPVGNTQWAESNTSGQALVAPAGSSSLGTVQSGALEASNVDLTKQLVDMIVAQRSFQANAQVVSAVDALTQTIVNLR